MKVNCSLSIEAIKTHFINKDPEQSFFTPEKPKHHTNHRHAAVILLLYPGEHGLELILTLRAEHLNNHPGQVSLPGGSIEEHDSNYVDAALREANEEIGLDKRITLVLGSLDYCLLPSGFAVMPIVAYVETLPELIPDPNEVAKIFSIPLAMILDESLYQTGDLVRNGIKREFYFFDFKEYYIWGATAGILRQLAIELAQDC